MSGTQSISPSVLASDEFIHRFYDTLIKIDAGLPSLIEFKLEVQKHNLMSLVDEANDRIQRYEHIYPYIKELCRNQTINPAWFKSIETVLNWALKKGRGKSQTLNKEIKNAWITYIVLLSCAMIDKGEFSELGIDKKFNPGKGRFIGLTGKN